MRTIGVNFGDDIAIDRFDLENECGTHSSIYIFYAEKLAEAKAVRDKQKDKLDLVLAQTSDRVRKYCADSGIKSTEGSISTAVEQDATVVEQKQAYREALKEVYTFDAAVSAMDHRKSQLDNLVQLWIKSYYSNKAGNATNSSVATDGQLVNYKE